MHLADHIRPLLQNHDCVIIPDFGGLVTEPAPARLSAARLHIGPPAKQVAFNQALTRNDGLLVDALSQYLRIPATQAREVLRHAVEDMHQELRQDQRTELPGIGVFRQAPDRGLRFDYTGTDNLLPAAFGLPELSVRPVLATDARVAREKQPALLQPLLRPRPAAARRRLSRLLQGLGAGVATGLLVLAGISYLPGSTAPAPQPAASLSVAAVAGLATPPTPEPQQATLAHNGWSSAAAPIPTPPVSATAAAEPSAADFDPARVAALARAEMPPAPVAPAVAPPAASEAPTTAPAVKAIANAGKAAKPTVATVARAKWSAAGRKAPALTSRTTPPAARKAAPTTAVAVLAAAPTPTTIRRPSGRSYVVAGAFDSQAGAEACRRNLVRAGFAEAKVLMPSRTTRRFRATVADYADLPSARRAAAQLRFQRKTFFDVYSY